MEASQFKKGMKVRVAESIPNTVKQFAATDRMFEMQGKIFKLQSLNHLKSGGFILYKQRKYVFSLSELYLLVETKPIPPITFDPKKLEV